MYLFKNEFEEEKNYDITTFFILKVNIFPELKKAKREG